MGQNPVFSSFVLVGLTRLDGPVMFHLDHFRGGPCRIYGFCVNTAVDVTVVGVSVPTFRLKLVINHAYDQAAAQILG